MRAINNLATLQIGRYPNGSVAMTSKDRKTETKCEFSGLSVSTCMTHEPIRMTISKFL